MQNYIITSCPVALATMGILGGVSEDFDAPK